MSRCPCCGDLMHATTCARCASRTICACGVVLSCGCGFRATAEHACRNVVTWPIQKIELSMRELPSQIPPSCLPEDFVTTTGILKKS